MATEKTYKISGSFEGNRFNNVRSMGFTKRQAKFRAGFELGLRGNDLNMFIDSRSVRVKLA